MLVNDIKKGTWGVLTNGWTCQFMNNSKGVMRLLDVYGLAHEMGSTYVWDVAYVYPESKDMTPADFMQALAGYGPALTPTAVELSPAQAKQKGRIKSYGF